MAKVFFENRFIMTRKLHKEYCKCTFKKTRKREQFISLGLFIGITVLAIVFLFLIPKYWRACVILEVLALYFLYFFFWGYQFFEWIAYSRMKDDYGNALTMVVSFYQDRISIRANDKQLGFKYASIEECVETENLYIFLLRTAGVSQHGQAIFKNGFTEEGKEEEFKAYINKKTGKEIFSI